jgi:uncharacterized hydrophobic protein (TIGR00271 family)
MESKFDFSESSEQPKKPTTSKTSWVAQLRYVRQLLHIARDTDYAATLEAVRADIPFRGATAWVLICSIFIASIGLNTNATAVVIGAMLIAPLMGPVLGVGVSLAINDLTMLKQAIQNFVVMVVLSVATATLYFLIFPLQQESSELLARTQPDIRDVFIAFCGGAALAIARTKKGTIASVIFGVAIATALMPPLCTIGYGLAVANPSYALGALYLFFINATFIAFASFLVIKLLRFPMIQYADSKQRRRTVRLASFIALMVMIPAGITFTRALKENAFRKEANVFLEDHITTLPFGSYLSKSAEIYYVRGEQAEIIINPLGLVDIDTETELQLQEKIKTYDNLEKATLTIVPSVRK